MILGDSILDNALSHVVLKVKCKDLHELTKDSNNFKYYNYDRDSCEILVDSQSH